MMKNWGFSKKPVISELISPKNHSKFARQVFGVNIEDMQNFTINLEESALEWAEIEAKRRNCSVAMLLGQLLKEKMLIEVAGKQPSPNAVPAK